jgi:hypothetical protein
MVYLRNRTWSKGASAIPFTALTGRDPDLSNIRVFGCPAYVNTDSSQRPKFSPKAWQGIFVGYAFDSPAWVVYNPCTNRVFNSRSVTFNETWTPSSFSSGESLSSPLLAWKDPTYSLTNVSEYFDQPPSPLVASPLSAPHAPLAPPPNIPTRLQEDKAALLVRRATNPRSRTEHRAAAQSLATYIPLPGDLPPPPAALSAVEPSSYEKALKSLEKANWLMASDKEFSSLSSKGN